MEQEEITLLIEAGLRKRPCLPIIHYPEHGDNHNLTSIFDTPYMMWLPETNMPGGKPKCINEQCGCIPRTEERKKRVMEDLNHKTVLLYVRYECKELGNTFETIQENYFRENKKHALMFPYIMTGHTGLSKDVFNHIHDGIMSSRGMYVYENSVRLNICTGLSRAIAAIEQRRNARYYFLLSVFAEMIECRREEQMHFIAPLEPSVERYMQVHKPLDAKTYREVWLRRTEPASWVANGVMCSAK
jgi:hypothetical protein